jgi:hypothetical protein
MNKTGNQSGQNFNQSQMSVGGSNPASLKGKLMSLEVAMIYLGNDQIRPG